MIENFETYIFSNEQTTYDGFLRHVNPRYKHWGECHKDKVYNELGEVCINKKALKYMRKEKEFSLHLNCGLSITSFVKKNRIDAHNQKITKANGRIKSFFQALKVLNAYCLISFKSFQIDLMA